MGKISKEWRIFLMIPAVVVFIGIWLTGFSVVSWVLYVPIVLLPFASITGYCPGMHIVRWCRKSKGRFAHGIGK
ncbi:MAG: hypothetical protein CMD98_06720 [Gammaproteobacteria bacterium]|nr:hypothetical protein [Gammaproteobacteria bacterium]|tara:strand:+ start:20159 stop:20380 length:222 start_codon:yes stop_codon:yes gene_type:complete